MATYLQSGGLTQYSMRYLIPPLFIALVILSFGFRSKSSSKTVNNNAVIATNSDEIKPVEKVNVKNEETTNQASQFVDYAKTLIGTPYLYGSVNPKKGLDCSGFVNCVSDHFDIDVPRSSVEFTNFGKTIEANNAKPGDLILFTGTDPRKHVVGHIGIITDNDNGQLQFIHSSSGKTKGVMISDLRDHYKQRLVKVIRIFPTTGKKIVG
jgi:cell wall-associated NlpC family hydrolase